VVTRVVDVDEGPDAFLDGLAKTIDAMTPAHRAAFIALVAERRSARLGEYADWPPDDARATALEMIEALWDAARDGRFSLSRAEAFDADLEALGVLVDPDRFSAFEVYRAIGVLRRALAASAAGASAAGAVGVAVSALAAAASASEEAGVTIPRGLRSAWGWEAVQKEARWLLRVAGRLVTLPTVDTAQLRALRDLADAP
jgi:hypothetical protein